MTRSEAREIAMRLCCGISTSGRDAGEALEEIFDKEYYTSLADEDPLYKNYPDKKQADYISRLITGIGQHNAEIDQYISRYSSGWEFHRISRTALAIMKVAMYEVMYMTDIPDSVAINEAVELAKKYEEPETVPFVNGVLGTFYRQEVSQIR